MKLSALTPDETLAAILDKQVMVEDKPIRAYANAERPNDANDKDFIEVLYNGTPQSVTDPKGVYTGDLALAIYSPANSDNTAKKIRLRRILEQVETLVDRVSADNIFFKLSSTPITPATITQTGYGMMVLNIEWHTTTEVQQEDYEVLLTLTTDGEYIYPHTSRPLAEDEGFCPLTCGRQRRRWDYDGTGRYAQVSDLGRKWTVQYTTDINGWSYIFPYRLNDKGALRRFVLEEDFYNKDFFDANVCWLNKPSESHFKCNYINTHKTSCSRIGIKAIKGVENYILYGVAVYRVVWDREYPDKLHKVVRISNVVYVKKHLKCTRTSVASIGEQEDIRRGDGYECWFTI